jgi:hypothetical protein
MAAPLTLTYVYALVAGTRRPLHQVHGVPGAEALRFLEATERLSLLVAHVPAALYGEEALARGVTDLAWLSACAVAHERTIEHLGRVTSILPMKLFTIFFSDERAVAHVRKHRRAIEALATRLADKVEIGVRVGLDPARSHPAAARIVDRPASGAAFLQRKKAIRDTAVELARRAPARAKSFHEKLAALAADAERRPPPPGGPRLLLEADYLVAKKKVAPFKKTIAREAQALEANGLTVMVTGPWPPYHFAAMS